MAWKYEGECSDPTPRAERSAIQVEATRMSDVHLIDAIRAECVGPYKGSVQQGLPLEQSYKRAEV